MTHEIATRYVSADNPELIYFESDELAASGDKTPWQAFAGDVTLILFGAATVASVQVEVSAHDPAEGPGPRAVPAGAVVTGDPATGISPVTYRFSGRGFWRARLTADITGSPLIVGLSGTEG